MPTAHSARNVGAGYRLHSGSVSTGRFLQLLLLLALCVFLPAGTLDYWEGWLFSAVFAACSLAMTLYLAVTQGCLPWRACAAVSRCDAAGPSGRLLHRSGIRPGARAEMLPMMVGFGVASRLNFMHVDRHPT
jgi:hypothetical protein